MHMLQGTENESHEEMDLNSLGLFSIPLSAFLAASEASLFNGSEFDIVELHPCRCNHPDLLLHYEFVWKCRYTPSSWNEACLCGYPCYKQHHSVKTSISSLPSLGTAVTAKQQQSQVSLMDTSREVLLLLSPR
jgi:hypothetical protein